MRNNILIVYIVLLVLGGLMGFLKGKSKISLISALVFALLLTACLFGNWLPHQAAILLGLLLVVFGIRLAKTRKFIPSGLMLALTALTLALRYFLR